MAEPVPEANTWRFAVGGVGVAVPGTLSTIGRPVVSVRPVASVTANVSPVKHEPLVITSKPPPFTGTGEPTSVTASG